MKVHVVLDNRDLRYPRFAWRATTRFRGKKPVDHLWSDCARLSKNHPCRRVESVEGVCVCARVCFCRGCGWRYTRWRDDDARSLHYSYTSVGLEPTSVASGGAAARVKCTIVYNEDWRAEFSYAIALHNNVLYTSVVFFFFFFFTKDMFVHSFIVQKTQ